MATRGGVVTGGRLSRAAVAAQPAATRPMLDGPPPVAGVVHFGVGAFHRAHQAVYTEQAMALAGDPTWGVVEVAPYSRAVVDALRRQDGLFTVLERCDRYASARVVNAVSGALHAPTAADGVLGWLSDSATSVVTLTITEKGYPFDRSAGVLADDAVVRADLDAVAAGRVPQGTLALLVAGLCRRTRVNGAPLSVLSCDNLTGNGRLLKALVNQFVARLPTGLGNRVATWVESSVRFPSSMVDRIVPVTTAADTAAVRSLTGLADDAAVVAEPFAQWVIEDDFAGPRPAWDLAGAELVTDVSAHETAKLRVLNAAHSMIAYLGALAGCDTIAEATRDPGIHAAVHALHDDVLDTIDAPPGWHLDGYARSVLSRFGNHSLGHRCEQVAADGSRKLPVRVVPTLLATYQRGRISAPAALVVAAWLRFMVVGRADDWRVLHVDDPERDTVRELAGSARPDQLRSVLSRTGVLPAGLAADDAFVADVVGEVAGLYRDLTRHGALETCRQWLV